MRFLKKVVLITGVSCDISSFTAVSFAREGASVALVGRNNAKLKEIAKRCEKLGAKTLVFEADVSKDKETDLIVQKTIDIFGKLDVLVNHAGISGEAGILDNHFLTTYDEVMNINMRGAIRITYFAAPYLISTKGNIINVSSIVGFSNIKALNIAYRTSKAAMTDFTKSIALELAPHGVRVNIITPGTDFNAIFKKSKIMNNVTAPKRLSEPNDIADMILYIASAESKDITGSNFCLRLPPNNN